MTTATNNSRSFWLTGLIISGTFSIIASVVFGFVGGIVTKVPWVTISIFVLPITHILSTNKEINELGTLDKISPKEKERLQGHIAGLKRYLLTFSLITILSAVISVFVLLYSAHSNQSLQYVAMFFGFIMGWVIYLMIALLRMHNQLSDFKNKVHARAQRISISRASAKKLKEKAP